MFPRLIWGLMLLGLGVPLPAQEVDETEEIDACAATQAFLNNPHGVAVDGAGNVYIADPDDNRVRRVDALTKRMTAIAGAGFFGFRGDGGPAVEARLNSPHGVATDAAGNVYIADVYNDRIRKVDAAAGTIATIAGSEDFCFALTTVCGDGGEAVNAVLRSPYGVAVDEDGDIYIADTFHHRVRKVSAGIIDTVAGSAAAWRATGGDGGDGGPADAAQLNRPQGVAADRWGAVYIADTANHRIRKVYPDPDNPERKLIDTVAGDGTPGYGGDGGPAVASRLNHPQDVAVDRSGNVYIADRDNHRIRRIDRRRGTIATIAGTGTGGFGGENGPAAEAQLNQPTGVAVDAAYNIYIADQGNRRIRKIDLKGKIATVAGRGERESNGGQASGVCTSSSEISFALPQDAAPASQTVALYVVSGDTDFEVRPGPRWITAAPESGSLAEDGEAAVEVTVNPLGLRVGPHRGQLYIRSGGSVTALVTVVLEVLPPLGPAVSESGVVNAAVMSALGNPGLFGPATLSVAPGSMVTVLGLNFTEGGRIEAAGFPLPTSLGGVRVIFDDVAGRSGGLAARLFAVGPNRIDAQLPSALGAGALEAGRAVTVTAVVETAEARSYPRPFHVSAHAPGIFTMSGTGKGQGAVLFAGAAAPAAPRGYGAESRPARTGDVVEIYATGLGPVEPPLADGMNSCEPDGICLADFSNVVLRRTVEQPRVRIGGAWVAEEDVLFSGPAPTLAGVNVVVVKVPPQRFAPSDAVAVTIAVGGRESPRGVTIAVE